MQEKCAKAGLKTGEKRGKFSKTVFPNAIIRSTITLSVCRFIWPASCGRCYKNALNPGADHFLWLTIRMTPMQALGRSAFCLVAEKSNLFSHIILFFPVIVKIGTNLYVYNVHFDRFMFDNIRLKRI